MTFHLPTRAEVVAAQEHLDTLCADRPLSTTEIFTPNAYYGFDSVLKSYAGVADQVPLKLVIPHGIDLVDRHVWSAEVHAPVPMVVCAEREIGKYRERTTKVPVPGATPFVYACELMPIEHGAARSGTLFFLSHSTHRVTAVAPFDELAEQLLSLPAELQPVSVCVYWRDYLLGHHLPFARRGLRIVSAGHMFDRYFLARLVRLCQMHRYACANEVGSHLFYTVYAGCNYFNLGAVPRYEFDDPTVAADVANIPSTVRESLLRMFAQPGQTSAEQRALVDLYMGVAHMLTPVQMRELFRFGDALDRIGTATWQGRRYWTVPRAWHRNLWQMPRMHAAQLARRILGARRSSPPLSRNQRY